MTAAAIADLFDTPREGAEIIAPGAVILRRYAAPLIPLFWHEVQRIAAAAPFRHMVTPGGHAMSVAMTNCGPRGWITDRRGYRYVASDPLSGQPWPALPASFASLAAAAAAAAGFADFAPNSCLVNRYEPGARMGLHQDRDEGAFTQPIVSVSIGLPALFLFGGETRTAPRQKFRLASGDVVVWGGPARLAFHGVDSLDEGEDALTGRCRVNLTFRNAV